MFLCPEISKQLWSAFVSHALFCSPHAAHQLIHQQQGRAANMVLLKPMVPANAARLLVEKRLSTALLLRLGSQCVAQLRTAVCECKRMADLQPRHRTLFFKATLSPGAPNTAGSPPIDSFVIKQTKM